MKGTFTTWPPSALMFFGLALLLGLVGFAAPAVGQSVGDTNRLLMVAILLPMLLLTGFFRRIRPKLEHFIRCFQPIYASDEASEGAFRQRRILFLARILLKFGQSINMLSRPTFMKNRVHLLRVLPVFYLLLTVLLSSVNAQHFNGKGCLIDDFEGIPKPATSQINVGGLGTSVSKNYGLVKVCMTIVHQRLSDIKITLTNPSGRSIWLTNRNGGDDATQYSGTCFSSTGFTGYIHEAKNPFNGEFIPDGKFEVMNEGDLEGNWQLSVEDLRTGATGTLSYWSLFFGEYEKNIKGKCSEKQPQNCICDKGKKQGEMLPDLILLPHFPTNQFQEYGADHPDFPRQIKFAVSIANIGNGPMEVKGNGQWFCQGQVADSSAVCQDGTQARQYIYQTIYRKNGNRIDKKLVRAGTNYYDNKPGHNHYHVDNWVYYQLLKVKDGIETEVCNGSKVSYCLFDSGICNDSDELCLFNGVKYGFTNLHNYGFGGYTDCYSGVQGISVGGYDTYGSMYEGQFLQLPPDVTNGEYILRITVDPKRLYRESNKNNNTLNIPVTLTKQLSK